MYDAVQEKQKKQVLLLQQNNNRITGACSNVESAGRSYNRNSVNRRLLAPIEPIELAAPT
jgi:hypothetical protein